MKNFEKERIPGPRWVRPDFSHELGEVERVAREFLEQEPTGENVANLQRVFESASIVELNESEWEVLENTDSFDNVAEGDIEGARKLIGGGITLPLRQSTGGILKIC